MMDDETGGSLSTDKAKAYAEEHGLVFMSGDDVIAAYKEFAAKKE
jgi:3,4-dihydroxy 2-butanone 4-phosphate synthase